MDYKLLSKLYYKDKDEYETLCKERKNSEHTEFLNIKIGGNEAFYCLSAEVFDLSYKIQDLDKKILALLSSLPPVAIRQFETESLINEIIQTNGIEGVHSTRKEIKNVLIESPKGKKNRFYGLVTKYYMLEKEQISLNTCQDIRKVYDELVLPEILADNPKNVPDGKLFRKDMAEVTTSTQKVVHKGVFPEEKIIDYMEQALKILNNEKIPVLIRISVFHYLFGYIHPFYDGNGRTSRFISSYLLSKNFENLIGYRLSYTIKENLSLYYDAFTICNDEKNIGDLTPFIITFLDIIYKAYEKLDETLSKRKMTLDEMAQKISELEYIQSGLFDDKLCYVLLQAALFSKDGISKKELCALLDISLSTLDNRLKQIQSKGYLVLKKSGHYNYYGFDVTKL